MKKNITESLEFAESIIDTIREPLIILNGDFKIVSASRSFYEVFKVTPEETVGNLIYDLGNKQWDIPKLRELLENILPAKTTFDNYEVEHDFTSIGRRIMLLNARQVERAAGKERLILLAIEDITERRRLQAELKESEERYRWAFETSEDGLLLIHKTEGDVLNSNHAARKLLGYSGKELLKKKFWAIVMVKDAGGFQETSSRLEKDGVVRYEDSLVKTKKGLSIQTDVFLVDRAKVILCNIRDITGRKQMQKRIIEQERFTGVGEAAASIAHEIRNSLSSISAAAQACSGKREVDVSHGEYMRIIVENTKKASGVISGLLSFTPQGETVLKPGNAGEVLDNVLNMMKTKCSDQGVCLTRRIGKSLPLVMLDESRLREAFLNIIINALEAMPGGGSLKITACHDSRNGKVAIRFLDAGEGILQEHINEIFSPFFSAKPGGTGLGLSLVKQVISHHNGEIDVKSEPGQGAGVMVFLPVFRESDSGKG